MYHYAGNNPIKYTDPDGRSPTIPVITEEDFISFLAKYDIWGKLLNMMNLASKGDQGSQILLNYIFHEATIQTLEQVSSYSSTASLLCLSMGAPEGAAVFSTVSTISDSIIAIDDLITGNTIKGLKEGVSIIAGIATSHLIKAGMEELEFGISITVGKNHQYYKLGHKGAVKLSKKELRRVMLSEFASGYFGEEVMPYAKDIVDKAIEVYTTIFNSEDKNE